MQAKLDCQSTYRAAHTQDCRTCRHCRQCLPWHWTHLQHWLDRSADPCTESTYQTHSPFIHWIKTVSYHYPVCIVENNVVKILTRIGVRTFGHWFPRPSCPLTLLPTAKTVPLSNNNIPTATYYQQWVITNSILLSATSHNKHQVITSNE